MNASMTPPTLAADARAIFEAAVRGVQADRLLEDVDLDALAPQSLAAYRRVVVAGLGKASMAMAGVLEARGVPVAEGVAVVPEGYAGTRPSRLPAPSRTEVVEAGHPVPDARSAEAGRRLLALADGCSAGDLLLALVSGGGTALAACPVEGLSVDDVQRTVRLLLRSGADIHAMNAVRKHLLRVGGGQLARAAAPADACALVVSDVVGDVLPVIASGPTAPDPSTFGDAARVLQERDLWEEVPEAVQQHLTAGRAGDRPETPKPGASAFERVRTDLVGANRDALKAARAEAEQRGYAVRIAGEGVTGEARRVARQQVEALRAEGSAAKICLLWGGETTVTVRGDGRGGRNQEAALAAALALDGARRPAAYLSGGTDGIDGPTDAAGAIATPQTTAEARRRGLDPQAFLDDNDAYTFFDEVGGLLQPGPTHTNVMDVQIGLTAE